MNITITEKDLNKYKPVWTSDAGKEYPHSFSPSGELIDELAYACGQWTSDDLWDNNFEYEPNEPYHYNYEKDLFEHTKTQEELYELAEELDTGATIPTKKTKLQAGAYMALNNPDQWNDLLKAYTSRLQEDRTDGISEAYNKQLQKEIYSYNNDLYREWLYGGQERDNNGVVYEIAKYFTEARDGSYIKYDPKTKTDASYTFELNEEDIENAKDLGYKKNQIKSYLIGQIIDSCKAREYKDKQKNEERKAERERLAKYKAEQAERAKAERIAKLSSMKL